MQNYAKWLCASGIVVLAISLSVNWGAQATLSGYNSNAQENLVLGVGLAQQGEAELAAGNAGHAAAIAYEGIGYVRASIVGMDLQGVHGVAGMADFLDQAMFNILGYTNSGGNPVNSATRAHDKQLIRALGQDFHSFGSINYGSISDSQINQAIKKWQTAMTPQERKIYGH